MKKIIFTIVLLIIISCSEHKHPDMGNGYKFDSDGENNTAIVNSQNIQMIGAHILECVFDSTYIVVSQRPWDSVPNIKKMTYTKSNEAFENSKFRQYWIINKKQESKYSLDSLSMIAKYSNVYGPFKKEQYLNKRKELGVPKTLKIE